MAWNVVYCSGCGKRGEVLGKGRMVHAQCPKRKLGGMAPEYKVAPPVEDFDAKDR